MMHLREPFISLACKALLVMEVTVIYAYRTNKRFSRYDRYNFGKRGGCHIYTIICLKSVCLSVSVRKRQVAILARSSREMSLTVRIVWQYILSRVRVSVWPSIFYTWKTSKISGKSGGQCVCLFQWVADRPLSRQRRKGCAQPWRSHGWAHRNSEQRRSCVGVCACVRDVFAIYDDNILSRLIMIIIKVIILYFIQIRHTDDFPLSGYTG